jgi:hypothetical protein
VTDTPLVELVGYFRIVKRFRSLVAVGDIDSAVNLALQLDVDGMHPCNYGKAS